MKILQTQGFLSFYLSLAGTRFPADSRSVCQKFARKFEHAFSTLTSRVSDPQAPRLNHPIRRICRSAGKLARATRGSSTCGPENGIFKAEVEQ